MAGTLSGVTFIIYTRPTTVVPNSKEVIYLVTLIFHKAKRYKEIPSPLLHLSISSRVNLIYHARPI